MMRRAGRTLVSLGLVMVLTAVPGPAAGAEDEGPFLGEAYRWPRTSIAPRVFLDLAAIPANVPRWDGGDWATFAAFGAGVAVLMAPLNPSLDVRVDRFITRAFDPWLPDLWGMPFQLALWGGVVAGGLGTWGVALWVDAPEVAQAMSLMLEAVSVSQLYHLAFKLLLGREGPTDGGGLGWLGGPSRALQVFPAGTPSGHAATFYALLAVASGYWDHPAIPILGHLAVGFLAVTHVLNHRHFASDSLWGAAMGWYVGRFVLRHRASRPAATGGAPATALLPWRSPDGAATGLAFSVTF